MCFFPQWSIFLVGGYILIERVWKRLHGPLLHATVAGVMRSKDSKGQLLISYLACHPGNFHFNGSVQHFVANRANKNEACTTRSKGISVMSNMWCGHLRIVCSYLLTRPLHKISALMAVDHYVFEWEIFCLCRTKEPRGKGKGALVVCFFQNDTTLIYVNMQL